MSFTNFPITRRGVMRKNNRNHQTQWAAQFAVASELCKLG